jgi:hypothetical protein
MTEKRSASAATRARDSRRYTLRRRLALWILVSTLTTLALFATTVYLFLAEEVAERVREMVTTDDVVRPTIEDTLESVGGAMLTASPLCIALSVGGALWLSRRALMPLDVVITEIRALTVEG